MRSRATVRAEDERIVRYLQQRDGILKKEFIAFLGEIGLNGDYKSAISRLTKRHKIRFDRTAMKWFARRSARPRAKGQRDPDTEAREQKVLAYIAAHPGCRRPEIRALLAGEPGVNPAGNTLTKLREIGKIEYHGEPRFGGYVVAAPVPSPAAAELRALEAQGLIGGTLLGKPPSPHEVETMLSTCSEAPKPPQRTKVDDFQKGLKMASSLLNTASQILAELGG
jgi:hypothetical protein